jgi:hypothetical protein
MLGVFRWRGASCCSVLDVEKARKEALIVAGKVAGGNIEPSRRDATKFEKAFAAYLEHLKAQAAKRGKPPRWHDNVKKLGYDHPAEVWQVDLDRTRQQPRRSSRLA